MLDTDTNAKKKVAMPKDLASLIFEKSPLKLNGKLHNVA
jgi:hypothetical protein